jgi:hypothetical protein
MQPAANAASQSRICSRAWGSAGARAAHPGIAVVEGLAAFGVVFAMNSSIHSCMMLAYTEAEDRSLTVGFHYLTDAAGRFLGTVLCGALFLGGGLQACLGSAALLVVLAFAASIRLPAPPRQLRLT